MADDQKTVFISYRRSASKHLARAIFMDLRANGYDVFLDVNTIDSGEFDRIILNQIAARAHFVVLLSPGAFERCAKEGDWLRREIEEAMRLKRNLVPVIEEGFDFDHETGYLPESWREQFKRYNGPRLFHDYFDAGMDTLRTRFLKTPSYEIPVTLPPPSELLEIKSRIEKAAHSPPTTHKIIEVTDILPQPFEWIKIPSGKVTLDEGGYVSVSNYNQTFRVPEFAIAKYPVTNAQFQVFIDDNDGYRATHWWDYSPDGTVWRSKNSEPRECTFKGDNLPRVDITWYESVAFCRWLSHKTAQHIMLPTEQQWQRAAQGKTKWVYPWGNNFDKSRCNFNSSQTTPVTQYPNGASPYGVMDMSGNVWEWCLTQYELNNSSLTGIHKRVLRGGSWWYKDKIALQVTSRYRYEPSVGNSSRGFRLARSL